MTPAVPRTMGRFVSMSPAVPDGRRGFTLIELVLVIVILAVLAGAIAPRVLSWNARGDETGVAAVAELLSVAARREMLTGQRLALDYDGEGGRLRLLTQRLSDGTGGRPVAPAWRDDPLAPAVQLDNIRVLSAAADGVELSSRRWRIEFIPATVRPSIVLLLGDESGASNRAGAWIVELPPAAARAMVTERHASGRAAPVQGASIDLDALGAAEDPW